MHLRAAIDAFNESSEPKIGYQTTRDGRTTASLPRVGREVTIEASIDKKVDVTASDLAWLCEEARRASAPGLALLDAGLGALSEIEPG